MTDALARTTPFVAVPMHVRAVQWDGTKPNAEAINLELNVLGREFDFAVTRAEYVHTTRSGKKLLYSLRLSSGTEFEVALTPGKWLAVFIRHGHAVMSMGLDELDGTDLFGEYHETLVIAP